MESESGIWYIHWNQLFNEHEKKVNIYVYKMTSIFKKYMYCWPLNIVWFHLYVDLFSRNICTNFDLLVVNSWMGIVNCIHWSMPLYIEDLSVHGFWYLQWILEPIPHGYWRTTVFGESKVTRGFWTARGREPLTPVLFSDQLHTHTLKRLEGNALNVRSYWAVRIMGKVFSCFLE